MMHLATGSMLLGYIKSGVYFSEAVYFEYWTHFVLYYKVDMPIQSN